jgi:uncharacterized lipoprotein
MLITRFLLILCTISLVGCAYLPGSSNIGTRDKQYLKAKSQAPLTMPPGVSSSAFQNSYPVPARSYPDSSKVVDITPPGLMDK